MAYIGVPPADRTSGARVRDEFTADGTQVCFQLSQEVPGSFESNIIAIVENVIQEPVTAYTIIDTVTVALTSISGTFTKNETVTGGTSSAEGTVIQVNLNNIVVRVTSGTFQNAETITGGGSSATATVSSLTTNVGRGLLFSGTPTTGAVVYVLHQNSATYQLKPAAGSVTPETLSENLRTFTVDKFTATSSQTEFTLSTTPVSVKSILVFVDGVMQTETTHYTLSGAVVTMGSGLASGQQVTVVHLGFSTVSRTAFADGSITTAMIADGAITSDKIATGGVATIDMADGSVTSLKIANGGIATEDLADSAITTAKINDGAVTAAKLDSSAVYDRATSSTGYFDIPSGTTAQRPASPASGMIRYNTDNGSLEFYNGSNWISTNLIPYVNSVSGTIYAGAASTLSLSIASATETVTVRFTEGGTVVKDVTGIAVTAGSASVTVPSEVYGQSAGDTIVVSVLNQDGTPSSNAVNKTVIGLPTGGTITTVSAYRYHTFTSSSNLVVPTGFTATADYLLVAGGAGGGYDYGGGGGAGGAIDSTVILSAQTYSISIGAGGAGGILSTGKGYSGTNSTAFGQTAIGGGGGMGGAGTPTAAASGGSGGGGGWGTPTGASGTAGQGNKGGDGDSAGGSDKATGGGGGAGAVGQNGVRSSKSGNGGVGINWKSLGTYYAGGGGGGGYLGYGVQIGTGGTGGGGNGALQAQAGTAGTANTGGGGGGDGGGPGPGASAGGSGICIVRYQLS